MTRALPRVCNCDPDAPDLHAHRARHLEAAGALLAAGESVHIAALHLAAAGGSDEPWAVAALREAAAESVALGRDEEAREFLGLAVRADPGGPAEAELADVEWWLRPAGSVRALVELGHTAAARRSGTAVLARRLAWHGLIDEAATMLAGRPEPGIEGAVTDVWLSRLYPGAFTPRAAAPPVDTVAATRPWLRGSATPEAVLQGLVPNRAALEPLQMALLALDDTETLDPGAPWFADLLAAARRCASRVPEALLTAARARDELRRGDLCAAEESAEAALRALTPAGWGVLVGMPLGTVLESLTQQGRHDEAAERLRGTVPRALGRSPYGLIYLRARGLHYLAVGRERAALGEFLAAGEIQETWGVSYPGLSPWMLDAARAHLLLGEPDAARALADRQLRALGDTRPRIRAAALRVYAATLVPARRPEPLREAVGLLEACGDRLELARCLAELGLAFEQVNERQYAHAPLNRAWRLAHDAGAVLLLRELADRGLDAPPAAPRGGPCSAKLSGAERRVAELAAQGYKNREIARRLFLTASTVEQHLTRIYRKLDVQRRSALPDVPGLIPAAEAPRPRRPRPRSIRTEPTQ
ncbi:LuxR C-terminal-related transcriptional regulator [Actinoplanes sp. NPDC049118]|uniref:helix-turn-helix transcriptional regulator n=1 Tax=Actinoplanes sp. NPDC049118 TaxID=3155769 RepID=UPI0033D9FCE2